MPFVIPPLVKWALCRARPARAASCIGRSREMRRVNAELDRGQERATGDGTADPHSRCRRCGAIPRPANGGLT